MYSRAPAGMHMRRYAPHPLMERKAAKKIGERAVLQTVEGSINAPAKWRPPRWYVSWQSYAAAVLYKVGTSLHYHPCLSIADALLKRPGFLS